MLFITILPLTHKLNCFYERHNATLKGFSQTSPIEMKLEFVETRTGAHENDT